MTAPPIYNPVVPCVHPIPGGIYPGRMVRVHGEVPQDAQRFSINLQCGPKMEPQDDIALHMDFRFNRNYVVRNHFTNTTWGKEETNGKIPFSKGQTFEILLLCDPDAIKVAINGAHFCSFHHRMPAQCITHVAVYGGVCIQYIGLEGGAPPLETPPFSFPRDPPPPYSAVTGYGATQVIATQPAPASAPMIQPNDGYPQQICNDCTKSVNSALNLRNKSHTSFIQLLKSNFVRQKSSKNKNKSTNNEEASADFIESTKKEESNQDSDDGNGFQDFQIEVEFERLSEAEINNSKDGGRIGAKTEGNGGKFDRKKDGRPNKKEDDKGGVKPKKMTRKERRQIYLNLVDGVLDPKGPVRCKVCKKTVSKWACFVGHAKLHLGFEFMCEFCGKSFISSTQLKRHCRALHGMQRELKCKHCSYLALDPAQLVLHERRMHTGERPYVCDLCAASYHSRRCLLQHTETHTQVATVQCERCPMKFKSARHLARHRYSTHSRKARRGDAPASLRS